jgi:hypothetical protein
MGLSNEAFWQGKIQRILPPTQREEKIKGVWGGVFILGFDHISRKFSSDPQASLP